MTSEKMAKTAVVLDRVFHILQIIMLVCAAVVVVVLGIFTIINFVSPDTVEGINMDTSINFGMLTFEPGVSALVDSADFLTFGWIAAASAVVFVAVIWYALGIFRKILKPMTEGNPFSPSVSREIRRLAFVCLIGGLLRSIVSFVEAANLKHILELSGQPQLVTMNYVFDLSCVVEFFVLLLISYIFSYGEKLQQLSDETL